MFVAADDLGAVAVDAQQLVDLFTRAVDAGEAVIVRVFA